MKNYIDCELSKDYLRGRELFPLSSVQKQIWYYEKLYPATNISTIFNTVHIKDELNADILNKAINYTIKYYNALRLRVIECEGDVRQFYTEYEFCSIDVNKFECEEDVLYKKWINDNIEVPLDIKGSKLYLFKIFRFKNGKGGFLYKQHHLISDAWSLAIVVKKVIEFYTKILNCDKLTEEQSPLYTDLIERETSYMNSKYASNDRKFWDNIFIDIPKLTRYTNVKPKLIYLQSVRNRYIYPKKNVIKLIEYSSEIGVSTPVLLMSILAVYLFRITGKNDIVIGMPIINRTNRKEKQTAGMFVSFIPIRIKIDENMTITQFFRQVMRDWKLYLRHQKYPVDSIIKNFRDKHNVSDSLFDIVFSFQNAKAIGTDNYVDYNETWYHNKTQIEALSVHFSDRSNSGSYDFEIDYRKDVFSSDDIDRLHEHYNNLLTDALNSPEKKLDELELLSDYEKTKLLKEFNDTKLEYQSNTTYHELFEKQVLETPNNIAVVCNQEKLSYEQLNKRANKLAWLLRDKGVTRNFIIGIMVDGSFDMFIGILAILKSGGAYLPIDPDYPQDRIRYMLEDSDSKILLTQKEYKYKIEFNGEVVDIEDESICLKSSDNPNSINNSEDLCYVIYTSGSTGKPKGIMVQHKPLINLCYSCDHYFKLSQYDRSTKYASFSFDASVMEIHPFLLKGSTIYVIPKHLRLDVLALNDYYTKNNISVSFLPTNICEKFMSVNNRSLRVLYTGGDKLNHYEKQSYKLFNVYGPAETTVISSIYNVESDSENIPIGKPILNTQILILDKNEKLLPIGVEGELCISGDCLSAGYINRPELTKDLFRSNPFVNNCLMYKTGDLARWLPDGNIEFLGRKDEQVKIRGCRIELGEIANCFLSEKGVDQAVVVINERNNNKYLIGFLTGESKIDLLNIKENISKKLPEFMVPYKLVQLEELPLTPNSKFDYKALQDYDFEENLIEYIPPGNEIEKKLLEIWQHTLGINKISVTDSIFNYGADSLSVMQVSAITFKHNWNIPVQDFYDYKSIREIAQLIQGGTITSFLPVDDDIKIAKVVNRHMIDEISVGEKRNKLNNILLTGATGYLGIYLLNYLYNSTNANIHCIVRGKNQNHSIRRLNDLLEFYFNNKYKGAVGNRIKVLNGDISLKRLGLKAELYNSLGVKLDTIYHVAALVKIAGDYSEFEKSNISPVMQLSEYSIKNRIKLNYISTTSVSCNMLHKNNSGMVLTENDLYIGQNYKKNVYIRSKFEAENIILTNMENGLDASIYRVGVITGRYADGHFQKNMSENRYYNLIKNIIESGSIPDSYLKIGQEFSPVDYCAKSVVEISKLPESSNKIFHIYNHNDVLFDRLFRNVLKELDIEMKILEGYSTKDYINFMNKNNINQFMSEYDLNSFFNKEYRVKVESEITQKYLNILGVKWPEIDEEYLKKLVQYMLKTEYLRTRSQKCII